MSSTTLLNDNKKHLFELDALRGILTFFVISHHYTMSRPQSNSFWQTGFVAVDAFFMISGFVITMSLERCHSPSEFLTKRAKRIYPTFWVCLTITTLVLLKYGFETRSLATLVKYTANLTLFHFYVGQMSIDGVYWTLVIEIWFYLIVALVFKYKKLDQLDTHFAIILCVLTLFGIYTIQFPITQSFHAIIYGFAPIIFVSPSLIAGICFYLIMFKKATKFRYLVLLFCFLCSCSMLILDPRIVVAGYYTYYCKLLVVYLLFLLFIRGNLTFIVNPVTLFLGKISYPLYLIHMNIGLLIVIPQLMQFMTFWPAAIITFFLMIALSFIILKIVEGYYKTSFFKFAPTTGF